MLLLLIYFVFFFSFPHSKGQNWENIFPTCTTTDEISLVDGLVKYNPKKRLSAIQVRLLNFTKYEKVNI